MGATVPYGFRFPAGTNPPNVPSDLRNLAEDINDEVVRVDGDTSSLASRVTALEATLAVVRWRHIDSGSETGSAFTITVPSGYERLRLTLSGDHAASGDLFVWLRINGDTSNHQYGFFTGNADTTGHDIQFVDNASSVGRIKLTQWSSVESNLVVADITPADGRGGPAVLADGFRLSTTQSTNRRSFSWGKLTTAAAVSQLQVQPDDSSSFAACHWWLEGHSAP